MKKFLVVIFAFGCLSLVSANGAQATTKTVSKTVTYKSVVGLKVASHTAITTFSYNGKTLQSPKSVSTTYSTAPPNFVNTSSAKWDWYTAASGRSNSYTKFTFGLPTPWGPVGSNYSSRIFTNVNKSGGYSFEVH